MNAILKRTKYANYILFLLMLFACKINAQKDLIPESAYTQNIIVGAERLSVYLPLLKGKSIGVVANQSSRVGEKHLVDVLIANNIRVKTVFSPEHGFRGFADAGEKVNDQIDEITGLPLISLYGVNKKPTSEQMEGLDIVVF